MSLDDYLDTKKVHIKNHVADSIIRYLEDRENNKVESKILNTYDYFDYYCAMKENLKTNDKESKKVYKNDFNLLALFFSIIRNNFDENTVTLHFNEELFEKLKKEVNIQ